MSGSADGTRYYAFGGATVASRGVGEQSLTWLFSDHQGTQPVLVHNCGEGVPAGVGNLKEGAHMATSDAMETAAEFVGPGYRGIGGDADPAHPRQNPHINFETYDSPIGPGVRSRGRFSNIHIYLPEEPGWHLP